MITSIRVDNREASIPEGVFRSDDLSFWEHVKKWIQYIYEDKRRESLGTDKIFQITFSSGMSYLVELTDSGVNEHLFGNDEYAIQDGGTLRLSDNLSTSFDELKKNTIHIPMRGNSPIFPKIPVFRKMLDDCPMFPAWCDIDSWKLLSPGDREWFYRFMEGAGLGISEIKRSTGTILIGKTAFEPEELGSGGEYLWRTMPYYILSRRTKRFFFDPYPYLVLHPILAMHIESIMPQAHVCSNAGEYSEETNSLLVV